MLCGARTRSGGRCRKPPLTGKRRCRNHGGASTGPGRLNYRPGVIAMWHGRKAYIARRHALGLRSPGGRPSGLRWKRATDDRERALVVIEDELSKLPASPEGPVEQWSTPQLFNDDLRLSLLRQRQVLSQDLNEVSDPKERRLI